MERIIGKAFDGHTVTGISGLLATFALTDVSTIASIAVGAATTVYMVLRCVREWRKIREEKSVKIPIFKK